MVEPEPILLEEKEIRMFGTYVAVCRHGNWVTTASKETKGNRTVIIEEKTFEYSVPYWNEDNGYFIDFIDLRQDDDGEWYEDDDSPVAGGLSVNDAIKLSKELQAAVEWIEAQND